MTTITIPDFSLVVLVGASGSGKSTFAKNHFLPTEVVSSDTCRALVSDDETEQSATQDAFALLNFIVSKRLARRKLTVVDATNVQSEARAQLLALAKEYHALALAIVLDLPDSVCIDRNVERLERPFGARVITRQIRDLRRSLRRLDREGFQRVFLLESVEEIAETTVSRRPLWTNKSTEHGPFDIIGDVHGCYDELIALLKQLGYTVDAENYAAVPPEGRRVILLGDLVDRGPKVPQVLKLVMHMVGSGTALCVPGNHDVKLLRKLLGRNVRIAHGLAESLEQLKQETPEFRSQVIDFLNSLVSHYLLDDGNLVVAHAGMKAEFQGRASGGIREFALYGETTGEIDEFGLSVRYNWAAEYRGAATVVYGHTPVPQAEWLNRTINVDTGCVFGGALTALRYPENELVSVPALQTYVEPARPFLPEGQAPGLTSQQHHDDVLHLSDVLALDDNLGQRRIQTRLSKMVKVRAENAATALEVMSRFAVDPKWLIYLPPTMSPTATSQRPDLLEHPAEAFDYYRENGVSQVICEEKHMGSRAVVVICKDADAARQRFGVIGDSIGMIYTRTGRRFLNDIGLEYTVLTHICRTIMAAGLWDELDTTWMVLDCELMPWSAKAQELLQTQYAAVGSAADESLRVATGLLESAQARGLAVDELVTRFQSRLSLVEQYCTAYRRYCWDVQSIADLRLAPFHVLASEGAVHSDKPHIWHMETLARLHGSDSTLFFPTAYKIIDVMDEAGLTEGVQWWEHMTENGGEGMVVKPFDFVVTDRRGLIQPAMKVRGREYLRIIYGPEYTHPDQLERLRARNVRAKRALATQEFALGIEALERFVQREPLRRVHECVFGVLALESEPIDPRL